MSEEKGTKELVDVVDLTLDVAKLGLAVAKDKKVDMADLGLLLSSLPMLIGEGVVAVQGAEQIPAELKDLSPEELSELVAHVMIKLSLDDAKATLVIEKSLKAAAAAYELGKAIAS